MNKISIIAPASAAPLKSLNQGLDWLNQNDIDFDLPKNLLKPKLFFASSVETQVEHIQHALKSEAEYLWCLRGGYGSARLIPFLEKMKKPKNKKTLMGFSDITALHLFFNQVWKWPTLHSRVLSQMDPQNPHEDDVQYEKLFSGTLASVEYKGLVPFNAAAKKKQVITSTLTGGNLRILETSIGTSWQLKADNKILFIEDVGERGYSIHRMLTHLEQAQVLNKKVQAVILGTFTEGLEKDGTDRTQEALKAFAHESSIPFFTGLPCGHGPINYLLPFGTKAQLSIGTKAKLRVEL